MRVCELLRVRQIPPPTGAAQVRVVTARPTAKQLARLGKDRVWIGGVCGGETVGALPRSTLTASCPVLSRLVPVVDELDHDADVDAAKIGGDCDLEWQLLRQNTADKVGGIAEHPLCEKDGRKTIDRSTAIVLVQLGRLGEEPNDKAERACQVRDRLPVDGFYQIEHGVGVRSATIRRSAQPSNASLACDTASAEP